MTTEFLIYLAKVALSILLLMGLFKAALAADHSFARNRFYLMGAVLWSIFVPLLTTQWSSEPVAVIAPTYTISLPELVVTAKGTATASSGWGDPTTIILTIYLTGAAIFLLRMMGAYARVLYIIATSNDYTIDSYNIKVTRAAIAPFAFFGWIVFPENLIDHRDLTKMLLHERVHSRQLHSIDLLLGELFTVFQWFNPASWMLKKLITENHEYTADRAVIDLGVSTYEYQASLVNATVGREVVPVNHFSLILIKKRIKMMNKNRNSTWLRVKSLLVPAAFVAALSLTSFTVEMGVNRSINSNETSSEASVQKQPSKAKATPSTVKKEDKTQEFQVVEQMPYFGKQKSSSKSEMMRFLAMNTQYPKEAAEKDIQGTVYVQFVVTKKGKITKTKVIHEAHPLLNEEAIRVTKLMPDWTPGKQKGKKVNVVFVLPVKFVLEGKKVSTSTTITIPSENTVNIDSKNKPMYTINGIEYAGDVNTIDTHYIKSISIYKDAASCAKYGDKSKNGIVNIKLKNGVTTPTTLDGPTVTGYK
ncbi:M56 family metallopeptidase [uncultured Acetobacteroides sp.]|uniref:M56 family metallopeptidase n=1 Tax=uncultured Acetobacteroides sp. TaxID=1760811 RepID=UPI0029F4FEA3|nr:M56 family metallopeptidase [uncultured Acetobacteroides sp.]